MARQFIGVLVGLFVGVGCSGRTGVFVDDVADDDTSSDTIDEIANPSTDDEGSTDDDGSTDDSGSTGDGGELDPPGLPTAVVDPIPAYRPVQGSWPVAAFDGTEYLAVWIDHRLGRPVLYGGRVTADGTALDPFGFRILDVAGEAYEYEPAVAFDGQNFLVVTRAGGQIRGVRVSPAGDVLDPGGFLIADPVLMSAPSLIFGGEQYQVAWSQSDPGWGAARARVKPDGTVLDPGGVFVHESYVYAPARLSFDGSNTLLSWAQHNSENLRLVYASRIAVDGTLIDNPPLRLSPEDEHVHCHVAGFDGTNHVIAWFSPLRGIQASRVTPEGTILDPDGFEVAGQGEGWGVDRMDMAIDDGRSLVVWSTLYFDGSPEPWSDPVRAAQIATDGTTSVYPADAFPTGNQATIAAHPDGALLLWADSIQYSTIVGTRLDAVGMPVADSVVAPATPASRQDVKAVASDGQNFFVLWTDTRDPTGEGRSLYGARVGADGTPLDPDPLVLTTLAVDSANVVFDGANFLVTWVVQLSQGGGQFNTVRVSPAGERLDLDPLTPPLCREVAGASDGTYTLLVGGDCGGAEDLALLLDQEGAMASELIPLPNAGFLGAAASFDGNGYLRVWSDQVQLFGQRITQAGALEDQPFSIFIVEGESQIEGFAIATGGGGHLVVWDTSSGLGATRVTSDGQVLDPDGLLVGSCLYEPDASTCSEASVVFDGENFVVAWRAPAIPGDPSSLDLYAAQVSPEGEVSPPFVISQEPESEGAPFLTANGEGRVLAAYSRFIPGPPYEARRAVATLLP